MSRFRKDEDTVVITGSIENQTAKAYLIDTPNVLEPVWIPKSQVVAKTQIGKNEYEFIITEWIANKNGIPF